MTSVCDNEGTSSRGTDFGGKRCPGFLSPYTPAVGCFLRLSIELATNALALWVCDKLFAGVQIHGFWAYAIGAAVLGFANAVIKPILTILTLPLVILTLGFFYLLIAIGMVALAAWIAPNFYVAGFWDYVGIVFIVWLVNWAVGTLLDRSSKTTIVISR